MFDVYAGPLRFSLLIVCPRASPPMRAQVSALAFLSEPVTSTAKPVKDKERKNSAALAVAATSSGSNRSSGASPLRDRASTGACCSLCAHVCVCCRREYC